MGANKKAKILFACSLVSKKHHYDGERRKSTDILRVLKDKYKVTVCNFTKNSFIQLFKFIICTIFCRKKFIFIAKAPSGGNILLKILRLIKYNRNKIAFYTYGRGFQGEYESKVDLKNINYARFLICEAESVKKEMIERGVTCDVLVFPCLKHIFDIQIPPFEEKNVLEGVFISRIVEAKGLIDLVDVLGEINSQGIKIKATISGGWVEKPVEEYVMKAQESRKDIVYLGQSFTINTIEDYKFLSKFDFHFFPTKFFHDCIPGSAVDAFIAGLPTICSEYANAHEIFNDDVAYFFEFCSKDDFKKKLIYIYEHQKELYSKRVNCIKEAKKYSEESFAVFFAELLKKSISGGQHK